MEKLIINTAFILGFAGSLHCFSMCGPISIILPIDRNNFIKMIFQNITYQLGRILSYTILGLFFGIIGHSFSLIGIHKIISIFLGLNILIYVFFSKRIFKNIKFLNKYIIKVINIIQSYIILFIKNKKIFSLFIIGILNGFLPCGLLYIAIITSISMGNILYGALFMLYFGIGTIPIMFITAILGNYIKHYINNNITRLIIPITLSFVGILLFLRGSGLDIKYLSPSNKSFSLKEYKINFFKKNNSKYHNCH